MTDDEARFARRLGLAVGMWDWWKLKGLHSPYEWELQRAADAVEPLGATRDDMRAATNSVQIIAALLPPEANLDVNALRESLTNYLVVNQPDDRTPFPDEIDAQLK